MKGWGKEGGEIDNGEDEEDEGWGEEGGGGELSISK